MDLVRMMQEGGAPSFAVLGLALLGLVVGLSLAVVIAIGRRVPAAIWLATPAATALAGALGSWWGVQKVREVLPLVDPDQRSTLAAAGLAETLSPVALGLLGAGAVAVLSATMAALASLGGQGREARWTAGAPQLAGGLAALGGVGLVIWAAIQGDAGAGLPLGSTVTLGGVAAIIAGLRAGPEEAAQGRRASSVMAVTLLAAAAAVAVGSAQIVLSDREALSAIAHVDPSQRATLVAAAAEQADQATARLGLAAMLGLGLIAGGLATAAPRGGRWTWIELGVSAVLGMGAAAAVALAQWSGGELRVEAQRPPPWQPDRGSDEERPTEEIIEEAPRELGAVGGPVGGEPIILGALDRDEVVTAIDQIRPSLVACYHDAPAGRDHVAGRVTVKFVVDKTGAVTKSELKSSTIDDRALTDCVVAQFRELQLPAPTGGGIAIVSYPVRFSLP